MTKQAQTATSHFRHDINALRAIAVLSVVFFHFNITGFSGGFVGVDVFFVISGFLMTSILVTRLEKKDIANGYKGGVGYVWKFYMARAKRIIPALLILILVLLLIGWWALPQGDYKLLSAHSLYALIFLSNVRFWREAGYFDAASHEKWLLHTWSLSVEWQFYLLLPLALLLLWRFLPSRKWLLAAVTVGFVVSLMASGSLTNKDPSGAFFLLPTRAWEMLAGGMVFLLSPYLRLSDSVNRLMHVIGLILITISILVFDASTAWPGTYALLPVVGTALILLAVQQLPWTRYASVQWVGLSSYSLYLWHWPVYVALVYLELNNEPVFIAAGLALSLVLGGISYHFVENPTRHWFKGKGPILSPVSIALAAALVAMPTLWIYLDEGVAGRMPKVVEQAAAEVNNVNLRRGECHSMGGNDFPWCTFGGNDIRAIVVGDSHASSVMTAALTAAEASLANTLDSTENNVGIYGSSYTSCPTLFGVKKQRVDLKCEAFNEFIATKLQQIPPHIPLIIVNRTTGALFGSQNITESAQQSPSIYFSQPSKATTDDFLQEFQQSLMSTTCTLAKKRQVYLVNPIPEMPVDVPRVMARKLRLGKDADISISLEQYYARHQFVIEKQHAVAQACPNITVLNTSDGLCENDTCMGTENGYPLYYDDNHLTERGNRKLVRVFSDVFTH
ncbi:acyltransferase family protein [Oceanisphaera ostreae]|uniref:Acyltransferase family protein n=1 Tax=Oceanisphaera ostreae TaxID=914151 RepID=A0ABW3KEM7_9GAMM